MRPLRVLSGTIQYCRCWYTWSGYSTVAVGTPAQDTALSLLVLLLRIQHCRCWYSYSGYSTFAVLTPAQDTALSLLVLLLRIQHCRCWYTCSGYSTVAVGTPAQDKALSLLVFLRCSSTVKYCRSFVTFSEIFYRHCSCCAPSRYLLQMLMQMQ